MKRVLMTIAATVVGIVALLSYKTHGAVSTTASGLPSAALPATSTSASALTSSSSAATPTTGAPPSPPATTPSSTPASSAATSAVYVGSAITTRYGVVQVKITVSGKKITNVGFAQLTAYDGRSQQINSGAAPILLQETLSAQSAHIDSVSGASYTSDGYVQSLQSAIDKAGL
jgi:uncharacterized protein with FMN-binding domain